MEISIISIKPSTTVDGPGLRTAVYCAGCPHGCDGCHNPQTWDIRRGTPTDVRDILRRIEDAEDPGVTFTGGDPMLQAEGFAELARLVKETGRDVWCYTGFTFEECLADEKRRGLLRLVDTLVDGRFVKGLRDPALLFRGSSNQRLVDVRASLLRGGVVIRDLSVGTFPRF